MHSEKKQSVKTSFENSDKIETCDKYTVVILNFFKEHVCIRKIFGTL